VAPGRVRLLWRHFALPTHPNAVLAGAAAHCAGQQGQFQAMHRALLQPGFRISNDTVAALALALRLDSERFAECLSQDGPQRVRADSDLAARLSISGTPTILLGRRLPEGGAQITGVIRGAVAPEDIAGQLDVVLEGPRPFPILNRVRWPVAIVGLIAIGASIERYWRRRSQLRAMIGEGSGSPRTKGRE
jgi:hypothetical protein